jgi:hypothetical protein
MDDIRQLTELNKFDTLHQTYIDNLFRLYHDYKPDMDKLDKPEAIKSLLSRYTDDLDAAKNDYIAKLESWYGVVLDDDLDAVYEMMYVRDDVANIIEDGIKKALKRASVTRKEDSKNKPVTWKIILDRKIILMRLNWEKTIIPALEALQAAGRIYIELPQGFDSLQDVPLRDAENIKLGLLN